MSPRTSTGISAVQLLPPRVTMTPLMSAARGCRGCRLYESAMQTVGRVLDDAFEAAGIRREDAYVTNGHA